MMNTTITARPIPIVDLPLWPAADRAAFEQAEAAGDRDAIYALVQCHAGIRPGRGRDVTAIVVDCVGDRCP